MNRTAILAVVLSLIASAAFVGCAKKKSDAKSGSAKTNDAPVNPALKDLPKEQQQALSKLSEADLKLVLAQKKCPVGGALGSMGTPVKVTHEDYPNEAIFVCCKGCTDEVKKDFKNILAKIKKKSAKTK